jgi:hypothetical protein
MSSEALLRSGSFGTARVTLLASGGCDGVAGGTCGAGGAGGGALFFARLSNLDRRDETGACKCQWIDLTMDSASPSPSPRLAIALVSRRCGKNAAKFSFSKKLQTTAWSPYRNRSHIYYSCLVPIMPKPAGDNGTHHQMTWSDIWDRCDELGSFEEVFDSECHPNGGNRPPSGQSQ